MTRVRGVLFLIFLFSIPLLGSTVNAACEDGTDGPEGLVCDESPSGGELDAGEGDDIVIIVNGDDSEGDPVVPTDINVVQGDGQDDGDRGATAGDDSIVNQSSGQIGTIAGDFADADGGRDTIINEGTVGSIGGEGNNTFYEGGILGDDVDGNGGADSIVNDGFAANLLGDQATGDGGNDTVVNQQGGFIGNLCGDSVDGDGGDDDVRNDGDADSITGDCAHGNGGDDLIVNNGSAGWVSGDDVEGDGGNDTIINNQDVDRIFGDRASQNSGSDGGDDSIVNNDNVFDGLYGDDVSDDGGGDTIINNTLGDINGDIYGDFAGHSGDVGDGGDDSIVNRGWVGGHIFGDAVDGEGGDDTIINSGTVDHSLVGDTNRWFDNNGPNNGGDDVITNTAGSEVGGTYTCYDEQEKPFDCQYGIVGDDVDGDGGDDSITNAGRSFYITGDQAGGDGGNDTIINSWIVDGWIEGDGAHGNGGDDNIFNSGEASEINGDAVYGNGGNDTIINTVDGSLENGINGDGAGWAWDSKEENFEADGGDDSIVNAGDVGWINGDDARGNGGNDTIIIESTGGVVEGINGDGAGWGNPDQNPESDGGDDYISNAGTVGGRINGDDAADDGGDDTIINSGLVHGISGDWAGWFETQNSILVLNGAPPQGGNDTIMNTGAGTVDGDVWGDDMAAGDGGNDFIVNDGEIDGYLAGDAAGNGNGGDDTIINNGTVDAKIGGDFASGDGGNDSIVHNGTVYGDIEGDGVGGVGGDDTIIINGYVGGMVWADTPVMIPLGTTLLVTLNGPEPVMGGDDSVVLKNGATGYDGELELNGGDGIDTLTFNFTAPDEATYDQLVIDVETARLAWAASPTGSGTISFLGQTYVWDEFEELVALLDWARRQGADRATIETEDTTEHPLTDGRLNYMDVAAPAIIYCADGGVLVLNPQGAPLLYAPLADVTAAAEQAVLTNAPVLVTASGSVTLTALPTGLLQVTHLPSAYSFQFLANACGVTAVAS